MSDSRVLDLTSDASDMRRAGARSQAPASFRLFAILFIVWFCASLVSTQASSLDQMIHAVQGDVSISGIVFDDINANGELDEGEPGLPDQRIVLSGRNEGGTEVTLESTTDINGAYQFSGLSYGTYTLERLVPEGWLSTTPCAERHIVHYYPKALALTDKDFGSVRLPETTAAIQGHVYLDRNGSGKRSICESVLSGWLVTLSGDAIAQDKTTTTNLNGEYQFTDLPAGTYTVEVALPSNWMPIAPIVALHEVSYQPGAALGQLDFGVTSSLFLPVLAWEVPHEVEPNDSWNEATGPLVSGTVYVGRFAEATDLNDYYFFELSGPAIVSIVLTAIPEGHNYDLVLRDEELEPPVGFSTNPGNANELISPNAPLSAGKYYIQVFNRSETAATQHYKLKVTYNQVLMVADFNTCGPVNNLGGAMGAACPVTGCPLPNRLVESYEEIALPPNRNCVVRLEYQIRDWVAFWLKLNKTDLSPDQRLYFDIRADATVGIPDAMKIELKRNCSMQGNSTICREVSILYIGNIGTTFAHRSVNLSDFVGTGWPNTPPITNWTDIEELVFTFEASKSGREGLVFLDNIAFGD